MQKSADAFRTISEVADDLSLPQHVLRFWETRFPQIRPLKRAGGRRYYRPADVLLLRTIRQLLYDDGYTIKGVQRLLKEQGAKGLGAGGRTPDAGDALEGEAVAFDGMPDVDDEAVEDAPLSDASSDRATDVGMAPLDRRYRAVVEETMSTVNECKRILDALLRPGR